MAEPYLGEIRLMSFSFPPTGWALCNGQLLSINQNPTLFSLLGTTYGGDGRVNFALPDFRARTPIHVGSGHFLGQRGGEQTHTLSSAEMPAHTHALSAATGAPVNPSPIPNNKVLRDAAPNEIYTAPDAMVVMRAGTVGNVGGSQAHLNMQPFLGISFCIALQGIFPSPN